MALVCVARNDKSRPKSRHGTFSTKLDIPSYIFAMAEVAMDVSNKRYYIEKSNINVKNRVYIQVF